MKLGFRKLFLAIMLVLLLPFLGACSEDKTNGSDNGKSENKEQVKESPSIEENKDGKEGEESKKIDLSDVKEGSFEGNKPIDFELDAFNYEETFKLSDYVGKNPIIINFFASWCPPCKAEMPDLNELYKTYKDKGLKVFAINLGNGDSPESVQDLISDYLIEFPVLKDEQSSIAYFYNVRQIPVNIFIGEDGIIREHAMGMQTKESYEEKIKALFNEKDEDEEDTKKDE